ncbi:MAG: helix-turn-helix domain-containing protein [Christensenellales bacterium]
MTLSEAVATRVRTILKERNMTQYRLEQNSGVNHSTMKAFLNSKYKSCNLTTVVLIIRSFGMTVGEFFSDEIFEREDLILD